MDARVLRRLVEIQKARLAWLRGAGTRRRPWRVVEAPTVEIPAQPMAALVWGDAGARS